MTYTGITGFVPGASPANQQGIVCASNSDLSGILPPGQPANCFSADGHLQIGSTALTAGGTNTRMGFITSLDGSIGITNGSGTINLTGGNAAPFVPNAVLQEFDDFLEPTNSGAKLAWISSQSGGTANRGMTAGTANNPGILVFVPSAGASCNLSLTSASNDTPIALGAGIISCNWVIKLGSLSGGGNTYRFSCGLGDGPSCVAVTDSFVNGVYFTYTDTVNSGNWQMKNTAASVTTTANSSTAASTSFVTLSIVINAAATSVAYYVDGNQVANSPLTTNIPTSALSPFFMAVNTAGTTPVMYADLFWITQVLSNPRPGPTNAAGSTTYTLRRQYTPTATSYQVLNSDSVIGVTSTGAPRTITMPLTPTIQEWTVKDVGLGAATDNITINGNGWNIIGDSSAGTFVINTNGGSAEIFFDGTEFLII